MQRNLSLSSENDCASCTWPLPGWPSQEWKCLSRRPEGGEEDAAPSSKPALTASSLPRLTKTQDFLFQARAEVGSGRKVAQLGSSWATPSHSWEMLVETILCNGLDLKNRVNFESLNAPQQGSDVESVGSLLCSEFHLHNPEQEMLQLLLLQRQLHSPAGRETLLLPRDGAWNSLFLNHRAMEYPGLERPHRDHPGGDLWSSSSWECPTPDPAGTPQQPHLCLRALPRAPPAPWDYFCSSPPEPGSRGKGRGAAAQRRGEGGLSTPCTTQLPHCWGILLQL